ncbi:MULTISPECIES: zinc-binding dehydrogenase [unclassified Novosphingobium]|uniref:zinc-binding dehydrogenase n=1 Tax=unclassified Novosphingobium TaxID=2644732 RepID=UPI000869F7F0|nr:MULTISPECIES: zinc-binding dehydrogenase [unclassified Novosphingobium]MDR6707236.1 alcohol dehydrogenase [Novosphingobium sp. 1748]ODU82809.1 MAG: alcohol dehydrogenase [Novosphingobium sp. SCN 63-17]OJX96514.1 MAG: alcohol dehydrogenase [Novosphingobium sp. 63-713]
MNTRTITAAVLNQSGNNPAPYGTGKPLDVKSVELADPLPGELLVRIDAAGLCHSDLSVINGDRPRPMPMALGHEAAATVLALGDPNERDIALGDRVVLVFLPSCGQCVACQSGEGYLCPNGAAANGRGELMRGGHRLSCDGAHVHHHLGVSAFASHAVVDRRSVVKVDADIPAETAALFGCAVLTGVGAVMNTAAVRPGESVLIYGLGGVGLAALLGALASGAQPVYAVDPSAEKRALALELGAAGAFAPGEEEAARGADVVVETVGKAAVLATAYQAARRGGRIVTVGLPNPSESLSINALSLVADGKTLMGSYMGSSIPSRDIPRYIALWRAGRLPVEKLLTSISPLSEINALMDKLASGAAIRQVVIPGG